MKQKKNNREEDRSTDRQINKKRRERKTGRRAFIGRQTDSRYRKTRKQTGEQTEEDRKADIIADRRIGTGRQEDRERNRKAQGE